MRAVAEILRSWEVDASGEGDIAPVEEFDAEARELLEVALPHLLPRQRAGDAPRNVISIGPPPVCMCRRS
ncbi:hypothetical protein ACIBEJ_34855 [Nonomuraea sp. NPDC050790]|uniref:hypothetical protein n=1 Tax=Nonomuraea sp. NPDC050790 TaxID=3364371 RepID=UPI003794FD60